MMRQTRRELIARGAAAAGLLGAGAATAVSEAVAAAPAREREELRSLLVVEQLSAFAYAHVLRAASLSPATARSLRSFLSHEREHARLLSGAIADRGGAPPPEPKTVKGVSERLAGLRVPGNLARVRSEDDAVRYLIGVETLAEGAYYSAMSRLRDRTLVVLVAQVMSCEAQHWTALSGLLHAGDIYRAVPYPVVLG